MIKRETRFLIAAIPAGFLPLAYALMIAHMLIAALFGVDITPERHGSMCWIGMVAIWLTFIQWPFYFFWAAASPELSVRQKVAWGVLIFLGNMYAMPYFLWCKYRNRAGVGLSSIVGEKTLSEEIKSRMHAVVMLIVTLAMMLGLFHFAWQRRLWKSEALRSAEFAANVWAANNFAKGKMAKLRLIVAKNGHTQHSSIVEDPSLIHEWAGYVDPLFKDKNSPSVQVARTMVETYNAKMEEMVKNASSPRNTGGSACE